MAKRQSERHVWVRASWSRQLVIAWAGVRFAGVASLFFYCQISLASPEVDGGRVVPPRPNPLWQPPQPNLLWQPPVPRGWKSVARRSSHFPDVVPVAKTRPVWPPSVIPSQRLDSVLNERITGAQRSYDQVVHLDHVVRKPTSTTKTASIPPRPGMKTLDVKFKSFDELTADIRTPPGELPYNYAAAKLANQASNKSLDKSDNFMTLHPYHVVSGSFCHLPLYFQECLLERFGSSHGIFQPLVSAAQFYGTLPAMPYKMMVEPPLSCVCEPGQFNPARCRVCDRRWLLPVRIDASFYQAAVVTGLIFLIP